MLSFSEPFVQNEEANALIERNVNQLLLDMMDDVIDEFSMSMNESQSCTPIEFAAKHRDEFDQYLAVQYGVAQRPLESARVFAGLYSLLKSRKHFVPTLKMERLLAMLIEEANDINAELGEDRQKLVYERRFEGEDRVKVLAALDESMLDIPLEEHIRFYETPEVFMDLCFWDSDYAFLDIMDEQELLNSPLNDIFGIGNIKDTYFTVLENWYEDGVDYADYNDGGED